MADQCLPGAKKTIGNPVPAGYAICGIEVRKQGENYGVVDLKFAYINRG
jgi:hypothetical protein